MQTPLWNGLGIMRSRHYIIIQKSAVILCTLQQSRFAIFKEHTMSFRPIKEKKLAQPFTEGAGVSLFRAFGFSDPEECDPFSYARRL